jgi:pantoate--beta-alanine ligase
MQLVNNLSEIRKIISSAKLDVKRIGLVPTMGALHEGHISLIKAAKSACDFVVVSIFVNPTQFGPSEDLTTYPRPISDDLKICEREGVQVVFHPTVDEMYPSEHHIHFEIDDLANHLCGASRPGHFNGVLQVVNKFFQIVQPDVAFFGQKDIQQFVLISRMVQEFNIPVSIEMVHTIREADGLAMSSRNRYLSDADRNIAPELYKSLTTIRQTMHSKVKNLNSDDELKSSLNFEQERLSAKGFKIDYLTVVDYRTLQPVDSFDTEGKYIIAIAAFIGKTRLIDNIIIEF